MTFPVRCENCGAHFALSPGHATDGLACSECGGTRLFRDQPSPTQSDGTLRDMVDSDSQKDMGGNPLGEGTIMGTDGEQPAYKRDNFMHGKTAEAPSFMYEHTDIPEGQSASDWRKGLQRAKCQGCGYPHLVAPGAPPFCARCLADQAGVPPNPMMATASVTERVEMRPNTLDMEPYDSLWHAWPTPKAAGFVALAPAEVAAAPAEAAAAGAAAGAVGDAAAAGGSLIGDAASAIGGGLRGLVTKAVPRLMNGALSAGENFVKKDLLHGAENILGIGGGDGGQPQSPTTSLPITQPNPIQPVGSTQDLPMILLADFDPNYSKCPRCQAELKDADHLKCTNCSWEEGTTDTPDEPRRKQADLETSDSVRSVGEQNDDPQDMDQKEFNSGDKSPSNMMNPNNEDSGKSGEDGVTPSFGPNSPGIDRAMMVLPLLLHHFHSPESAEHDPIIKALHETLEQESPGYLKQHHPDSDNLIQQLIQHTQQPHGVHAGVNMQPGGLQAPVPGGAAQSQMGGGRCTSCGGVLGGDGGCPQCGAGAQPANPGLATAPPHQANTQGPQTPEQKAAVVQYLIEHHRGHEAPMVEIQPENFAKELADITRAPNLAPLPDPSQVTPLQPAPPPGGSMPAPDMSQPGGGQGGQPMQPMSALGQHGPAAGPCQHCGGLGCPRCAWTGKFVEDIGPYNERSLQEFPPGSSSGESADMQHLRDQYLSAVVAADSVAPRCPKCKSGTTGLRQSQGVDGTTAECNACGNLWRLPGLDVSKSSSEVNRRCPKCNSGSIEVAQLADRSQAGCHACGHIWDEDEDYHTHRNAPHEGSVIVALVDLPNPVQLPAAERHDPTDHAQEHDTSMTWKDNSGQELAPNQIYEIHSPAFAVPDIIKIIDVNPDHISVKIVGQHSNLTGGDDNMPDFQVTRQEAQLEHYTFVPSHEGEQKDMDDRNTEPPSGTPGLEQVPPSGQTTDEASNSFPHTSVSHIEEPEEEDKCRKCGSTAVDHEMSSAELTMHQCVRCTHAWETKDHFEGKEAGVDLSWLMNDDGPGNDDFFEGMERAKAMRESGVTSRNLSDIAQKDPVYQRIHDALDEAHQQRVAGKMFSPTEKRALIDEHGDARNLEDLDLSHTHYDAREDYSGKTNPDNVPESHLLMGL